MKIPPVKLQFNGDFIFVRRCILFRGLREPISKVLDSSFSNDVWEPAVSFKGAIPITNSPKAYAKTPRIYGGYLKLDMHCWKTGGYIIQIQWVLFIFSAGSKRCLRILLHLDRREWNTVTTPFGLHFCTYGLYVSLALFKLLANSVVYNLVGIENYQDDLLVHGLGKSVLMKEFIHYCKSVLNSMPSLNHPNAFPVPFPLNALATPLKVMAFIQISLDGCTYLHKLQWTPPTCRSYTTLFAIYSKFLPNNGIYMTYYLQMSFVAVLHMNKVTLHCGSSEHSLFCTSLNTNSVPSES